MKKVRLFAMRSQRDDLLRELMLLGCVEVSEPEDFLKNPVIASTASKMESDLTKLRQERGTLLSAIEIIDRYAPPKGRRVSKKSEIPVTELFNDDDIEEKLHLASKFNEIEAHLRNISCEEDRQKKLIAALTPWKELSSPLSGISTRTTVSVIGAVPSSASLKKIEKALSCSAPEAQIFRISTNREHHFLLLVCLRGELDDAIKILGNFRFAVSQLSEYNGTASENIEKAEKQLKELTAERDETISDIIAEPDCRDELMLGADIVGAKITEAEAAEKLLYTGRIFALAGWVASPGDTRLAEIFAKYDCAWEISDPEETDLVPQYVKSGPFGKFARDTDRPFKPLVLNTEFVDIAGSQHF